MTSQLETGDMIVVTVRVPTNDPDQLAVAAIKNVVRVLGPDGFRHEVVFSKDADLERLHGDLFRGILELRAPRAEAAPLPSAHAVPVRAAG
jgi:HSP20 family molecular chaperone IbpA